MQIICLKRKCLNLNFKEKSKLAPEIKNKKIFTFLFAGNIGEAQDFLSITKAVKILSKKNKYNF